MTRKRKKKNERNEINKSTLVSVPVERIVIYHRCVVNIIICSVFTISHASRKFSLLKLIKFSFVCVFLDDDEKYNETISCNGKLCNQSLSICYNQIRGLYEI